MLEEIKKLIDRQISLGKYNCEGLPFTKYQKTYFSTNENIKGYLDLFDLKNKDNALTVLSSGDHLFNLINKDIKNIDTFDSNKLCYYYVFGIKMALIEKYNYKEYLEVTKLLIDKETSFEIINNILYELLPHMDNKFRKFWEEILNYNYKEQNNKDNQLSLIYMLFLNINDSNDLNNYLINEEEYYKLKKNLKNTNINYKNINAVDLYKKYENKYDLILLSNILEYLGNYFNYNDSLFEVYINSLKNMLNNDGIMFLQYVFRFKTESFERAHIVNYEYKDIPNTNILEVDSSIEGVKDSVLVLKK